MTFPRIRFSRQMSLRNPEVRSNTPLHPVVAIIQARVGSSRLPGKVLEDLNGWPLLSWTIKRVQLAQRVDRIVLATGTNSENDPLEEVARSCGVDVFRGSEDDVLGRFAGAARQFKAETVVRVCADSPLVAPEFIDSAVFHYESKRPDLAYNLGPLFGCGYPFGMGCEVFGTDLLFDMDVNAREPSQREHVTPFIHEQQERFDIGIVPYRSEWGVCDTTVSLAVDTPEDLERMRKLMVGMQFDVPASVVVQTVGALGLSEAGGKVDHKE